MSVPLTDKELDAIREVAERADDGRADLRAMPTAEYAELTARRAEFRSVVTPRTVIRLLDAVRSAVPDRDSTGERARAVTLATWVLDDASRDPDSDMSILARQFLRAIDRAAAPGLREAAYAVYSGEIGLRNPKHPDILALGVVLFPHRAALATPPTADESGPWPQDAPRDEECPDCGPYMPCPRHDR